MEEGGGDPPHRLQSGADSSKDPEQDKPDSPPSADTPKNCPPDIAEAAKTLSSAAVMVELPVPPETPLQSDELKPDDLVSSGAGNGSPQSRPLWGEALSGLPEPLTYHWDRNSGVFRRREQQPQNPGLRCLAEKPQSVDSSPFPSYWGEIETGTELSGNMSRATNPYHQNSGKPKPTANKGSVSNGKGTSDTEQSHWNSGESEESDPTLLAMFHAVANSRLAVKSQQKDEPDFTPAEKLSILRDLYHTKPLVFLERFRTALHEEHLPCFRHLSGNYEADFYCAEVRRSSLGKTQHTRVRNKRYAALQQLIRGGEYFSDEQMRSRDPLLYEQYIGQYLSEEELQAIGSCKVEASCPLSGVLLDSYQEQVLQRRLQIQQEQEEACGEEDEESDSDVDEAEATALDSEMEECAVDEEEKALLREEFTSRMYRRFLDGKDRDFNYSEVDENPDFDNLDIVSRDEEERYFDGEDPEDADAMEEE